MAEHQAQPNASSIAFRAIFHEFKACGLNPISVGEPESPGPLKVHVLFTNTTETLRALKSACALTAGMRAIVALLVPVTVPFPLPLEEPPVTLAFVCRRITEFTEAVGRQVGLEAYVYLCRNPIQAVLAALTPHSLVIIGVHRRWPFCRSRRMAKKLRGQGHDVVLVHSS